MVWCAALTDFAFSLNFVLSLYYSIECEYMRSDDDSNMQAASWCFGRNNEEMRMYLRGCYVH